MSRTDPTGKRALFTGHTGQDLAADGKKALFSGADERGGPVIIDCARCGETSHIEVVDAVKRLASFSLWIPGRTYSRRMRCPTCQHRSWVRIRLF